MKMGMRIKGKIKYIIIRFCIAVLICFMGIAAVRFLTRQILVERLHMNNAFTRLVFWDNATLGQEIDAAEAEQSLSAMNWQELYPFHSEDSVSYYEINSIDLLTVIEDRKSSLEKYTSDFLPGYQQFVEAAKEYEAMIGWNVLTYNEYNGVVKLDDNYLVGFIKEKDVSENVMAVTGLYQFCRQNGIEFLYVQAPGKISREQDAWVDDRLDFSNSNIDKLLEGLADNGVPYLDIRQYIAEQKLDYHALFYNTDHHWRAETGLWASGILAEILNRKYDIGMDFDLLLPERFTEILYEDWFLGSQGKKMTLSQVSPDDFCLLYPKYETSLYLRIPDENISILGDFFDTYDMSQVEILDYYRLNPYGAYNQGDHSLITIHNNNVSNGKKVLFIKDSYGNAVIPFIALVTEDTEALDLRYFDGSLETYIQQSCPDIVIILYNPGAIQNIDIDSHISTFDFR